MIILILLAALFLRVISLDQSLWLDEGINVIASKENSLIDFLTTYLLADFHPPGYFLILWLWSRVFGFSEVAVRIPSVVFGIFTILLIYLIGARLHSKKLGLVAALILALNPLHIYYSQEARMYSYAVLTVAFSFYSLLKLINQEKKSSVLYFISLILLFSSDYLVYLVVPAQLVILFLLKKLNTVKVFLIALFTGLVCWLWWVPFALLQFSTGTLGIKLVPGWKLAVGGSGIKPLILTYVKFIIGRIDHPDDKIYFLTFFPIGLLFGYLLIKGILIADKKTKFFLLNWLIFPISLALLISFYVPIYSYFRLVFVLPAFVLIVSLAIVSHKNFLFKLLLGLAVVIQFCCSLLYLFTPSFHREDWKGLAAFLKRQPKGINIIFESSGSFAPFDYYSNGQLKGIGGLKKFPASDIEDVIDLDSKINPNQDIFLINYLVDISDPKRKIREKIIGMNFREKKIYDFNGVGFVYQFVKQ